MLINPSALYSGGNVRLDSTPYLRMAMQQRYKKQALNDALYKHYSELPDKLNSAGARIQDFDGPNGGINQDIGELKEYFMENRDDILKGGRAQQIYAQKIQGVKQKIGQSKSTAAFQLKSGDDFFKGKHDYREDDLKVKNAVEQSIYDPAHYKDPDTKMPYTFNDYSVAAAAYTPAYQLKHDKVITANVQPDKLEGDVGVFDPVAKKVTYNYGYTPEKVQSIVQTGLATLQSDKTMYYAMEDALKEPEQVEIASKALQEDYDRTHNDGMKVVVDTPEEMYAGLQMNKYSNAKIPKTFTDKASIDQWNAEEWNRRNAITFKQKQQLANMNDRLIRKRKVDGVGEGEIEVGYPTNEIYETIGVEKEMFDSNGNSTGVKRIVYEDEIPVGTFRGMNPKDINKGIYPVKPKQERQLNGTYRPYYEVETNPDGNKDYIGAGNKKIGAEDARNNFIKEVVPTKVKLKINQAKPGTTAPAMKNKPDYYNIESNVSKSEGNTVTYKDGTVWELKGNKMVQIK